jgi:hypothetical protein
VPQRDSQGALRLPIADKMKDLGQQYIFGKIESGKIFEGKILIFNFRHEHDCAADQQVMRHHLHL